MKYSDTAEASKLNLWQSISGLFLRPRTSATKTIFHAIKSPAEA